MAKGTSWLGSLPKLSEGISPYEEVQEKLSIPLKSLWKKNTNRTSWDWGALTSEVHILRNEFYWSIGGHGNPFNTLEPTIPEQTVRRFTGGSGVPLRRA